MTVRVNGAWSRWANVDRTTPIADAASSSGGALATGTAGVKVPDVTKIANSTSVTQFVGRGVASVASAWGWVLPSGWTANLNNGTLTSPNVGDYAYYSVYEAIAAAGAQTGPTVVGQAQTDRSFASWAARTTVLKPAATTAPTRGGGAALNTSDGGTGSFSVTLTGLTAGNNHMRVDFSLDDPNATAATPSGWTQAYRIQFTDGVFYGFYKPTATTGQASSESVTFTLSTVSAPTVTSNPVITASHSPAHTGDAISVSTPAVFGAGSSSITGYERRARSWDGATYTVISGFGGTASTLGGLADYTIQSADDQHSIQYQDRAINSVGAGAWATSNDLTVLNVPVNTVAPTISVVGGGSAITTAVLTVSNPGTWTGAVEDYTYQWYRNGTAITGQTASSYTLVLSDEGAAAPGIRCSVAARNNGGAQSGTAVFSNAITPATSAPLSDDSFIAYYSGGSGNATPSLSVGGARGATIPAGTLSNLFGPEPDSVALAGTIEYRLVYVRNGHATATAAAGKAYVAQQFASAGLHIAVAVPSQSKNTPITPTDFAALTWTTTTDPTAGLTFPNLAPNDYGPLAIRLTVDAGAARTSGDLFDVAIATSAA